MDHFAETIISFNSYYYHTANLIIPMLNFNFKNFQQKNIYEMDLKSYAVQNLLYNKCFKLYEHYRLILLPIHSDSYNLYIFLRNNILFLF